MWVCEKIEANGKVKIDFGGLVEQGNEIISKYKIINGVNEFFYKSYRYELDWSNWREEDHGRTLQVVEYNIGGKRLRILNIHGIWTKDKLGDDRTIAECCHILNIAKKSDVATIITGDFNLFQNTESIEILNEEFRNLINENNINSTRPDFDDGIDIGKNVVDYIFVNDKIKVNNFEVVDTNISDHLPLILDFDII